MFKKLKKKLKKTIDNRIGEYCYHELKRVTPKRAQGLFNNRCFDNAVDYALSHKDCKVIMGIYIEKKSSLPSLHFWVRKNEKDLEISIGYKCDQWEYYEIRIIDKKDYNIIGIVFDDGLDYYKDKFLNTWEKFWIKGRIL